MSDDAYVPVAELDEWRVKAEIKQLALGQRDIEARERCPGGCGKIGIWAVERCTDPAGAPIPDGAYCPRCLGDVHAGESGYLSLNSYGWVRRDGAWFTWDEGFPRL